ncbi:hypothetical protein [Haloglomus litoreum]|uniref:hypothetical protein n=1 Tax=Haloglomus litoreum TaxID=3034026 RepID=UPI0023E81DC9|nr:hypothetical protein [Haloglomus sp. DT116]
MYEKLDQGQFAQVKIDRISRSGRPLAITPRNGIVHVPGGVPGEKVVIRYAGNGHSHISSPINGEEIIYFHGFYEWVDEERENRQKGTESNRTDTTAPRLRDGTRVNPVLKGTKSKKERKSKRELERENIKRILRRGL